ncbi:MAG: SsrA-binding protein SmpB [Gemmatimonadota bacterium]|jgi:SsrA-binding protein|nr:SsrA-binding protein SmpB [Gemmatimonadota bacterium]MDP6803319.1 SsrA-binding protein SmpB [Gemmatimonadota bacterium]MDP7032326.1 SsrA-binding protein SmpB [Gemmatimonadota bacterium]
MDENNRTITSHKKARHDYHLIERMEAGLSLTGTEVKSLRAGKASLSEAYARIDGSEVFLVGAHIPEYKHGNRENHEPTRKRKLLLHRREIDRIIGKIREKGLTLVPLRLYWKHGRVKVEIALARGKRSYDRRDDIAATEARREMRKAKARRTGGDE